MFSGVFHTLPVYDGCRRRCQFCQKGTVGFRQCDLQAVITEDLDAAQMFLVFFLQILHSDNVFKKRCAGAVRFRKDPFVGVSDIGGRQRLSVVEPHRII